MLERPCWSVVAWACRSWEKKSHNNVWVNQRPKKSVKLPHPARETELNNRTASSKGNAEHTPFFPLFRRKGRGKKKKKKKQNWQLQPSLFCTRCQSDGCLIFVSCAFFFCCVAFGVGKISTVQRKQDMAASVQSLIYFAPWLRHGGALPYLPVVAVGGSSVHCH